MPRWIVALLLCVGLAGCGKDRTQIMLALATDLRVPDELDFARLRVFRLQGADTTGFEIIKQGWDLRGGASLPGSFGLYSSTAEDIKVRIAVEGFTDFASNPALVVTREAIVTLRKEETRFLRLALVKDCRGKCSDAGQTCIEGQCASPSIDATALPRYEPAADPTRDLTVAVECDSGSVLVDTATNTPMLSLGQSCTTGTCREGTCLAL